MDQVPILDVGALLRIHHMEVFSWRQCVTVVEDGVGDNNRPINTRKGNDMNWG